MSDTIYFVRHGQTEWNVQRRLQGRGDSPLTPLGRTQAQAHRRWLQADPPEAVIASPLGRVQATVALATEDLGLPVTFDEALAERCMGEYEGWSLKEIADKAPELAAQKNSDPWAWLPPGGEDYDQLFARTAPLVQRLKEHPATSLLVVSHGTIVRPILAQFLALDRDITLRISSPNDLAYRMRRTDEHPAGWTIEHRAEEQWQPGLRLLPPPLSGI
ncbi:MAG: histidine phosphatase family protein [Pseudomonadota bacterium]